MKNNKGTLPLTLTLLPDDLIVQILLRLSVRSQLRSKCVCKLWFSLISDPQFAESHFDMALAPTNLILMKSTKENNCNSVDIEAPLHSNSANVFFEIPLPSTSPKNECSTRFLASCRGLIFLVNEYRSNVVVSSEFVVWNPATGFQKRIKVGMRRFSNLCGFGYDSSTDDYLVVNLKRRWRPQRKPGWKFMEVEWFSFRTNSWCRLPDICAHYFGLGGHGHGGVILNEALHWLIKSNDHQFLIIVFDMRERRISEIQLPHNLAIGLKNRIIYLKVMGGCLSVCVVELGCRTTIWTMKQYKVQSSWIKSFVPSCDSDPLLSRFYPICYTRGGQVLGSNGNSLVRLNDKGELLEHHTFLQQRADGFSCLLLCMHRESLLSLPG